MDFFIKQNSSFPELKFPLIQKLREQYEITADMLENVAVTFSMVDADSGLYKIANMPANLVINKNRHQYPTEEEYTLMYHFTIAQTSKSGRFIGEFVIDFLGNESCGKIKLPVNDIINIIISDSITKTTVL